MYTPKHFREEDLPTLHALMHDYNFAILVTQQDGIPQASHLPFILDRERGQYGTLLAHMARANTEWRSFATMAEVLIIFQGPHTYVTPSWYEERLSVPTWNYAAVHAYGKPRIIEDVQEMYALMEKLIQQSEARFEEQWQLDGIRGDYSDKLIRGTVGFEIEITRLEGKYKLSQNRPVVDRVQVAERLRQSADAVDVEIARLMQIRLPEDETMGNG